MVTLSVLPSCFGTHEPGHPDCDGDPDSGDALLRRPCGVREDCKRGDAAAAITPDPAEEKFKPVRRSDWRPVPEAAALYDWFRDRLAAFTNRAWAEKDQAPTVGQLYDANHMETSDYVSVFVRAAGAEQRAMARVMLRADGSLDVYLPCAPARARKAALKGRVTGVRVVEPSRVSGLFGCVARGARSKGVVGALAQIAARLAAEE